jgi:hypothetical protein
MHQLDVHFISSSPVERRSASRGEEKRRPVRNVGGEGYTRPVPAAAGAGCDCRGWRGLTAAPSRSTARDGR